MCESECHRSCVATSENQIRSNNEINKICVDTHSLDSSRWRVRRFDDDDDHDDNINNNDIVNTYFVSKWQRRQRRRRPRYAAINANDIGYIVEGRYVHRK